MNNPYELDEENRKYNNLLLEVKYYNSIVHKIEKKEKPYENPQKGELRKAKNNLERKLKELQQNE